MALLGLAELRLNAKLKLTPPDVLLVTFASRGSSLGHWTQWLDWVYANRSYMVCFKDWTVNMRAYANNLWSTYRAETAGQDLQLLNPPISISIELPQSGSSSAL